MTAVFYQCLLFSTALHICMYQKTVVISLFPAVLSLYNLHGYMC